MKGKSTIVLLDDNPVHLQSYGDVLGVSYVVQRVDLRNRSVPSLVDEVWSMRPRPVAILLDVFEGTPTGGDADKTFLQLLSGLTERFRRRVPIIAFTGRVRETHVSDVLRWYRSGVDDWIWKPPKARVDLIRLVQDAVSNTSSRRKLMLSKPSVFLSHGGATAPDKVALRKLVEFLEALGTVPLVVEAGASEGMPLAELVPHRIGDCECAVILATRDRKGPDKTRPRQNVIDEIGRCLEHFGPRRVILLLEAGCELPSNYSGMVYGRFTPNCMEAAFVKVVKELRSLDLV